ncbi:flavodoxin domain-containing protein [Neptunomonas concharum]|uniref:Flavodoxin-like domain-containing protein n=1 Tax=Neptunomonas concharum TaxID=1031538 RepID=A0A5P1RDN4_9GAMM|nr:flavodoxin domain-containing protein [Neptunomonas concharum]QEQ97381.1 hypothetical protein F0U83_12025 [Neptunomonas concharum]
MVKITLLVGTTYGFAQELAEQAACQLRDFGCEVTLCMAATLDDIAIGEPGVIIVCCATIGQGDIPNNLLPLYETLQKAAPAMPYKRYGVIALGDSSYEYFAGGGKQMDALLASLQLQPIQPMLIIDACESDDPEIEVASWIEQLYQKI